MSQQLILEVDAFLEVLQSQNEWCQHHQQPTYERECHKYQSSNIIIIIIIIIYHHHISSSYIVIYHHHISSSYIIIISIIIIITIIIINVINAIKLPWHSQLPPSIWSKCCKAGGCSSCGTSCTLSTQQLPHRSRFVLLAPLSTSGRRPDTSETGWPMIHVAILVVAILRDLRSSTSELMAPLSADRPASAVNPLEVPGHLYPVVIWKRSFNKPLEHCVNKTALCKFDTI